MSKKLLEVASLQSYYGESQIIHKLSLEVMADECLVILGRNGMGKTTLLRSLMNLTPPRSSGKIRMEGRHLEDLASNKISLNGIGYVPQGRRLFPSLSVHEHLTLFYRGQGSEEDWNPEKVYQLFPSLAERRKNSGASLSGGEQQMLAIGRALVTNPTLFVMDEPTEGLAPNITSRLTTTVQDLIQSGIASLVTEQDLAAGIEMATRVFIISIGTIVERMTAEKFADREDLHKKYLGVD